MLPIIGITTTRTVSKTPLPLHAANEAYIRSVRNAGGLPMLIPVSHSAGDADELLARLDGVLLSGGGDMEPALFHGEPNPKVYGIDAERDTIELALVRRAAETGVPFLGICRGCQVINVAFGGTLYTDIADQKADALKHDYFPDYPREHLAHAVSIDPGSRLAEILGTVQPQVNSLHHQGIRQVAESLTPTAAAPDGIVEALELNGHPFGLAVQWHPEWLQHLAEMRALFQALAQAAAERARRR